MDTATQASEITTTDTRGRVLTLKRPSVLAQFRLVEMLGDTAKNEVYTSMVLPLIYLQKLDGEPVSFNTKLQMEALIQRLDEPGFAALGEAIATGFTVPATTDEAEAAVKK
ncbi:MAG: hypothetical protein NVS9B10_15060 [Nevskia sp.]